MAEHEQVLRSPVVEVAGGHWFSSFQLSSTLRLAVTIVTCMGWTKATWRRTCAKCSSLARYSPCRAAATAATSAHEVPKR